VSRGNGRALAVAGAGLLSTGCISQQTLGRLDGVRFEQVLDRPEITELISKGVNVGEAILGGLVILLAFHCAWRAWEGRPWTGLVKEWLIWVTLAAYLMASLSSRAYGPIRWIFEAGQYLGHLFEPDGGYWAANRDAAVGKLTKFLLTAQAPADSAPEGSADAAAAVLDGFAMMTLQPTSVVLIILNGILLYLVKLVMQASYVFLLVFYWTLTPLVLPLAVLPATRNVFIAWLKSYIGVALWPMFLAITERIAVAIPWSTWMGLDDLQRGGDLLSGLMSWGQGQIMLLVLNLAFLAIYLSIPVVSNRIVTGMAQHIRTGLI
jgi:hypothetical protein